jgi:hypothetical protein
MLVLTLFLEYVFGLDVSSDGSIVVGASQNVVTAFNTTSTAMIWQKEMSGDVDTLRIHGGVVIVPVDNTVVLDVTTGHQLLALPSAGEKVVGVCAFDGLIIDVLMLCSFDSLSN